MQNLPCSSSRVELLQEHSGSVSQGTDLSSESETTMPMNVSSTLNAVSLENITLCSIKSSWSLPNGNYC